MWTSIARSVGSLNCVPTGRPATSSPSAAVTSKSLRFAQWWYAQYSRTSATDMTQPPWCTDDRHLVSYARDGSSECGLSARADLEGLDHDEQAARRTLGHRAAGRLRGDRIVREASRGDGVRRAPGDPRHARRDPGRLRGADGRARPRAHSAWARSGGSHDRRDTAARLGGGRGAGERNRLARSGLRRLEPVAVRASVRADPLRRAGARRAPACVRRGAPQAFVAGVEIEAKLGRALNPAHYEIGWHATATLGVFGAAAAAAKLLGLSAERTAHALAIAASMASGIKANFGTDCKPLHVGHAARCGTEAALLAAAGVTGDTRALEQVDGFGSTHGAGSRPEWELTTAGLGAPHDLVDPGIGVKRFPACASTHQALDATLALAEEHAIDPKAVVAVECGVSYMAPHQLIYDQAETGLQGKFSMPYCIAVALLDRTVGLAQFAEARVRRADAQALMPKVRMFVHPEQTTRESLPTRFSEVAISLMDGRRLTRRVRHAKGQPQNPLTDAELTTKFHDCAARVLPRERAESVLAAVQELETAPDVGELAKMLSRSVR